MVMSMYFGDHFVLLDWSLLLMTRNRKRSLYHLMLLVSNNSVIAFHCETAAVGRDRGNLNNLSAGSKSTTVGADWVCATEMSELSCFLFIELAGMITEIRSEKIR